MSRKKRTKRKPYQARPKRPVFAIVMLIGVVAAVTALALIERPSSPLPAAVANISAFQAAYPLQPKTLRELLDIPISDLGKVDVARMNLLCATEISGADGLDVEHALNTLGEWAKYVRFETERHLYRLNDPRYAEHYRSSEPFLRSEMLVQILQVDLGVKFDKTAIGNFSFENSQVAFLHGMIPSPKQTVADTPGGTCASMPVLYVAIGRRLGYPMKLATTNSHIFVRWDGEDHPNPAWQERFNIEASGEGFSVLDDAYYKKWPFKTTDDEVRRYGYLQSLTPEEELSQFLAARGHVAMDNGAVGFAARCYENAHGYDPQQITYRHWFVQAAMQHGSYQPRSPLLATMLASSKRPTVVRRQKNDRSDLAAFMPSTDPFASLPGSAADKQGFMPQFNQNPSVTQSALPQVPQPTHAAVPGFKLPTPQYSQPPAYQPFGSEL